MGLLASSRSSMKENHNILVSKLQILDYGVVQHPTLIRMGNGAIAIHPRSETKVQYYLEDIGRPQKQQKVLSVILGPVGELVHRVVDSGCNKE